MAENVFAPVTPGEILKEEFLTEYGLSQNQLAKAIGISPNRIAEIVNNRRRITADTALRLSLYFGNSPEFWLNLQSYYDLKMARHNLRPEEAKRIKARKAADGGVGEAGRAEVMTATPMLGVRGIGGQRCATTGGGEDMSKKVKAITVEDAVARLLPEMTDKERQAEAEFEANPADVGGADRGGDGDLRGQGG